MITGTLQTKKTKKGTKYFYMVLQITNPDGTKEKPKWEATGLTVPGNKRKAQTMLNNRIAELSKTASYAAHKSTFTPEPEDTSTLSLKSSKGANMLFSEWISNWIASKVGTVRDSTLEGYILHSKHIIKYFSQKGTLLSKLTYQDIDSYCTHMLREGKVNKQTGVTSGLSIRTVRSHKFIITSALNKAILCGLIDKNPAEQVKVTNKKNKQLARKPVFFTLKEAKDYLDFLKSNNDVLYDITKATLFYGLRKSEALGLTVQAIDFKNHKIFINHTVVKIIKIHEEDDTKTYDSNREYPLTPDMEAFFRSVIAKKKENARFFGNKYHHSNYIFTWDDGRPFSPDYIYHHHTSMVKKFGKPNLTFHNLRHSTASILYESGWSAKDIQEWLGHADYYTTMNIYTHIAKSHREEKAQDLERILEHDLPNFRTNAKNVRQMPLQTPLSKVM